MQSSQLTQQEVIFNANTASSLIEEMQFDQAISHLSKALNTLKALMLHAEPANVSQITKVDHCMFSSKKSLALHSVDGNDGLPYFFDRPIYLPHDACFNYETCIVYSSAIIFNMALAYQLSASPSAEHRHARLEKASKLYQLGWKLQCDANLCDNVFFSLATINNLGLVYQQINRKDMSHECFDNLLSTIMYLVDIDPQRQNSELYGLDNFLRNVTMRSPQRCAPAA